MFKIPAFITNLFRKMFGSGVNETQSTLAMSKVPYVLSIGVFKVNDAGEFETFYKEYANLADGLVSFLVKSKHGFCTADVYVYAFVAVPNDWNKRGYGDLIKERLTYDKEYFHLSEAVISDIYLWASEQADPSNLGKSHLNAIDDCLKEALTRCDIREDSYGVIRRKWMLATSLANELNVPLLNSVVLSNKANIAMDLSALESNELSLSIKSSEAFFKYCRTFTLPDTSDVEEKIILLKKASNNELFYQTIRNNPFLDALKGSFSPWGNIELFKVDQFTRMVNSIPFETEWLQRAIAPTGLVVQYHGDENIGKWFTIHVDKPENIIANSSAIAFDFQYHGHSEFIKLFLCVLRLSLVIESIYAMNRSAAK